ncbi:cell division protein FtsB [Bradyrhizobium sp. S3.2.6]|uniref:AAA family ATPase n=1 Tax=Bradyrhizobium sp. S3.2.6 TaxID=3156428 RepID=UPI003391548D
MTKFKPILEVQRLRIERLGNKAYDEVFHQGVNIIRGDNSSGKSTILNFLYYSIGGDVSDWSDTALLCTRVLVQVSLNGNVATLAREIAAKSGQPMDVFGGHMNDALAAPTAAWARYPYRRSESRESFSQILFRLLDIPEASNEASGNVTVHQMLRLMYADQLSPIGTLFKFEQFDPPLLRDTVGRLVFGAYENALYANELRLRLLEKQFTSVSSELDAISKLVGETEQILTPSWIEAEYRRIQQERSAIERQIAEAERAIYESGLAGPLSLEAQRQAYGAVQKLQVEMGRVTAAIDASKFEIADAGKFISDLESKLGALNDSSATSDAFGAITFQYCPACYSAIEADHPEHACHLCKTPFDSERARSRLISLINDTSRQLRQSRTLQKDRTEEFTRLNEQLVELNSRWRGASDILERSTQAPSSEALQRLRTLQRSAGYADRELEDIQNKAKLSAALEKLIERKAELNAEMSRLADRNEALKLALGKRLSVAYTAVENEILSLLHGDLPREQAFVEATSVQFDFAANKLGVNNQSYFSASSRVILRNSFFVGLFGAATKDPSFRHLRLCILDSIEDKGMQPDRSHNFQRMLVAVSQAALCEHQAIFATSMIAPELEIPNLTIGHYSTRERPTLDIRTSDESRVQ